MKVKELIEKLKQFDEDLEVYVYGEDMFSKVEEVKIDEDGDLLIL